MVLIQTKEEWEKVLEDLKRENKQSADFMESLGWDPSRVYYYCPKCGSISVEAKVNLKGLGNLKLS